MNRELKAVAPVAGPITRAPFNLAAYLVPVLWLSAASSAIGAISPDNPGALQQGILQAYAAGSSSVVIPAGVYLLPPQSSGPHLDLENLNNFEIDARGATLVFQDVTKTGIFFYNCNNVYFHGATIYFATPPFSQGVVQAVASDNSSIDVQIDAGYPTNLDDPTYFSAALIGHLYDPQTRLWKRNVNGDVYGTRTQRLTTNTFRIFARATGGAAAGDLIGIRAGTGGPAIRIFASAHMNLADLTILNSPTIGVSELAGGPNQYSNITIRRGNRPAGAVTDPLFSTGADGIHSTGARTGPLIQNCNLANMPDDGIAIHGNFSMVIGASGNVLTVSNTAVPGPGFSVGDPVRLVDDNDAVAGEAVVTAIVPLPNYQNSRKSARQTERDFSVGPYYQITLDRQLTAGFDYLAANPAAGGAGFVLQNNTIYYNRGRGFNLKADNGLVQGNTITGNPKAGIRAGPEYFWLESGFSHNLTIRNNTISGVGYWGGQTAAMLIAPDQGAPTANGYQNLTIDSNTFTGFDILPFFVSSATGVTFTNNIFKNVLNAPPFSPNYLGADVAPGTLAFVTTSSNVQFSGNKFQQLGPLYTGFVMAAASTIQGVTYPALLAGSSADFSGVQGANNWQYGYFSGGNVNSFLQLPVYNAALARWQHATFGPPWTLLTSNSSAHPNGTNSGAEEWAVRRWISPSAGNIQIQGLLVKVDTNPASTGVYGRIYLNHKLIYEHFLAGTDGFGTGYSLAESVQPGDILDVAVAPNGADAADSTIFSASISTIVGTGPYITGVANSAGGQSGAAPGTYVSLYGLNFAPAGFLDSWNNAIVNNRLPISLDGVSVSVGGTPAYIVAVSPTQINVLTSANEGTGLAPVVVTTPSGSSSPLNAAVQAVQPGFFLWPGSQPVATHADFSYAAKNGTFAGATLPAQPGEVIVLWGTGFGPTNPAAPDGQIVPPTGFTVSGVKVSIGGSAANVLGTALTPGLAGLYQIAVQVPASLANGDYPVVATISQVQSPSGVVLSVHQ